MQTYVVKTGDTLPAIATRFDLHLDDLAALNPHIDRDLLFPGQVIQLSAGASSPDSNAPVRYARVHVRGDDGLNMRTRPHVSSHTLIATAHAGAVFELLEDEDTWWRLVLFRSDDFEGGRVEACAHSAFLRHFEFEAATAAQEMPEAGEIADVIEVPESGLTAYTRRQKNASTGIAALAPGTKLEVAQRHIKWVQVVIHKGNQFAGGTVLAWVKLETAIDLEPDEATFGVIDISQQLPRHRTHRYETRNLDNLEAHVVHHSASPNTVTPMSVANWHVAGRDWPGIGYTFFIAADGTIYQCHPLNTRSWAVRDHNDIYLSTCLVGHFTGGRKPTMAQMRSLRWLHRTWIPQQLGRSLPLLGHKEGKDQATSCPGVGWDWHDVVA